MELITREKQRKREVNEQGEIYGIRFHPDTWEIQFYRRVKENTP